MAKYNILDFGANPDANFNNQYALQRAIDECAALGGGKVIIPAGHTFVTGPFNLRSHIELHVEHGAILKAIKDEKYYTQSAFKRNRAEGSIWIGGKNIEHASITGGGIIDGSGIDFMGKERKAAYDLIPIDKVDLRPHILTLVGCDNVKIRQVTFKNAAYWALHLVGCNDVSIKGISIYNSLKVRNSDGIDLDHCENVNITNCHIESGDDCICFKNRREYAEYGPCQDITITGCTLKSTSCAIKFGSENVDKICRVIITNCVIKGSNRGIGFQNRDEGSIENIIISNIIIECRLFSDVWWGKAEPIYITAFRRASHDHRDAGWRLPKGAVQGTVGPIRNISFSNILCDSENGIFVAAEKEELLENIHFDQIKLHINKKTTYPGGQYDCRPCAGDDMIAGVTAGFYLRNIRTMSIQFCRITWGSDCPDYYKEAINAKNITELEIIQFIGEAAQANSSAILLEDTAQKVENRLDSFALKNS